MQSQASDDVLVGNNFTERLVELVEKHKTLYDTSKEGYSSFQNQDDIWRRIAAELDADVAACKLKWKNIRSCYTRYLRQISSQNCRVKRKYYLAKHLKFLLPFCKPNTRQAVDPFCSDDLSNTAVQHESQMFEVTKNELFDEDDEKSGHMEADVDENEDESEKYSAVEVNANNKRQMSETTSEYELCCKRKIKKNGDEADMAFFTSLLPDIRNMTGKQKNLFKIRILNAVDNILYGEDS